MPELFDRIRTAAVGGRVIVSNHADDRLRERGIAAWQVVDGLAEGKPLRKRPKAKPNAVVEVEQVLPDGAPVKAVWAWLRYNEVAKLVTVHFFDG